MTKQETAADNQISVINRNFCVDHSSIDLFISKNIWEIGQGNFVVTNSNGEIMFKIQGSILSLDRKRVMYDAAGIPIATLRKKAFSLNTIWQVFRGEGEDENDLIFSARRSSIFQIKTKIGVFMAKNKYSLGAVCDYMMQGSWFERYSCQVYVGDSSTILAQMQENMSINSLFSGKDRFKVKVYENVDCAFIVALFVIHREIVSQRSRRGRDKLLIRAHFNLFF